MRFPSAAPFLGSTKASACSCHSASRRDAMAGAQHRRRSPCAPRARDEAAAPSSASTSWSHCTHNRSSQRSLDRRLQGRVQDRQRQLLLPPHHRRPAHAISAHLSRAPIHSDSHRATRLRENFPRVRAAACDPDRQWRPLRGPRQFTVCHISTSGGCGWEFSISASSPDDRIRTERTSECTAL
jgi:hypothetical protein